MSKEKQEYMSYLQLLLNLGLSVIGSILFFFFIGLFLDQTFGLNGIAIMIGIAFGLVSAFLILYKILKKTLG
jgi:hypothetical protein